MAQRPTPRDGWNAVSDKPKAGQSRAGSPVLRSAPSTSDATLSFADLKAQPAASRPQPDPSPEASVALTDVGLPKLPQRVANDVRTKSKPPARSGGGSKTLLGVPAPIVFRGDAAARPARSSAPPAHDPRAPSAKRPPAVAASGSPAAAAASIGFDKTIDISLRDISLADVPRLEPSAAKAADSTQDLSLADVSVTESTAGEWAADPHEETQRPPASRGRKLAWALGAALPVLAAAGWFGLRGAPQQPVPPPAGQVQAAAAAPEQTPLAGEGPAAKPASAGAQPAPAGNAAPDEPKPEPAPGLQAPAAPALAETPGAQAGVAPAAQENTAGAAEEPVEDAAEAENAPHPEGALSERTAARVGRLVKQADALRKRRKYAPAKARYQSALKLSAEDPRALEGLAHIALAQHDAKLALKLADELVAKAPGELAYRVLLGDAYKSAGKLKEARRVWQEAARKGSPAARARLKK